MTQDETEAVGSIIEFSEDVASAERPPLLPKGKYLGRLADVSVGVSKEKGRKYLAETWLIPPEAFPADYDASLAADGLLLSYNRISVEDNARSRFRLKEHCIALGVAPPKRDFDASMLLDAEAMVEVDHDTWEGVERETIKRITKKV